MKTGSVFFTLAATFFVASTLLTGCSSGNAKTNEQSLNTTEVASEMPEGTQRFTLDGMELIEIQDAANKMSAQLFPDATPEELKELMPTGEADASVNVFLLKKDGKNILFDAGNGGERGTLLQKLAALNMKPEDIDAILITHFHGDHIGGLLQGENATFSKAELWASETEYNAWLNDPALQERNTQVKQMVAAYGNRLHTFQFDQPVYAGIVGKEAIGHTPGHTIYEIGNLLIFGDLLHAAALQLPHPEICARFDMDKDKAIVSRNRYYNYAAQNKKMVAGMHLPFPGVIEDFSAVWKK